MTDEMPVLPTLECPDCGHTVSGGQVVIGEQYCPNCDSYFEP